MDRELLKQKDSQYIVHTYNRYDRAFKIILIFHGSVPIKDSRFTRSHIIIA